jgi:hypothetical protein
VDVLDFLDKHGCETALQEELAEAIFKRTDGRYEATTALLGEGLRAWKALLHRLVAADLHR